jgi:predicted GIY-YIG superfamily endonuclease
MNAADLRRRDWGALETLADKPHWVYSIYSTASGRCVYVGMTCDLRRRLSEHARRGWKAPAFTSEAVEVADRATAERVELEQMRLRRPIQNRYPTSIAKRSS